MVCFLIYYFDMVFCCRSYPSESRSGRFPAAWWSRTTARRWRWSAAGCSARRLRWGRWRSSTRIWTLWLHGPRMSPSCIVTRRFVDCVNFLKGYREALHHNLASLGPLLKKSKKKSLCSWVMGPFTNYNEKEKKESTTTVEHEKKIRTHCDGLF